MRLATIITILVILASSVLAHADDQCHLLQLSLSAGDSQIGSVKCSKGKIHSREPFFFLVEQSGGKGPSCDMTFVQYGFEVSKIHIQQNLCALKAGDIHVSHLSGRVPIVTIEEGSFSRNRRGAISITGFR